MSSVLDLLLLLCCFCPDVHLLVSDEEIQRPQAVFAASRPPVPRWLLLLVSFLSSATAGTSPRSEATSIQTCN
jgi:hypothetical protein